MEKRREENKKKRIPNARGWKKRLPKRNVLKGEASKRNRWEEEAAERKQKWDANTRRILKKCVLLFGFYLICVKRHFCKRKIIHSYGLQITVKLIF